MTVKILWTTGYEHKSQRGVIVVKFIEFSDGAFTCKLEGLPNNPSMLRIILKAETPVKQAREELALVCNAVQRYYGMGPTCGDERHMMELELEYLPYGRADRIFEDGNPCPLKLFLQWVDSQKFQTVYVIDPHNYKCLSWFSINWKVVSQVEAFSYCPFINDCVGEYGQPWDLVVVPDEGAKGKGSLISALCKVPYVQAEKKRNIQTGQIEEIKLPLDYNYKGAHILIPDDIADGCSTFTKLADLLKNKYGAASVDLYVTHFIGSNHLDLILRGLDHIYCYQIISDWTTWDAIAEFNTRNSDDN